MINKPIAVFDIDGTIFRSSLLIELNEKLVRKGIFPATAEATVRRVRGAWLNRHGSYDAYIRTIIRLYHRDLKGRHVREIRQAARELLREQQHRVYIFTRDLVERLRKTHRLVIISYSPREVVEEFKRVWRFDFTSGMPYAVRNQRYTGGLEPGFVQNKKIILQTLVAQHGLTLQRSVGVGDTESDIDFLSLVRHPIAFNPNTKLYATARRRGWRIMVERKDVIYNIPPLPKRSPSPRRIRP